MILIYFLKTVDLNGVDHRDFIQGKISNNDALILNFSNMFEQIICFLVRGFLSLQFVCLFCF